MTARLAPQVVWQGGSHPLDPWYGEQMQIQSVMPETIIMVTGNLGFDQLA